jgi:hypothetical protein
VTDQDEGRDSDGGGDRDPGDQSDPVHDLSLELPPPQPPWPPLGRYKVVQPVPPPKPPNPVFPYVSLPGKRRRRSDWHVLVSMLLLMAIILIAFCMGGYALHFGLP